MYIPKIYIAYPQKVSHIHHVILACIFMVNTKDIQFIYLVYTMYVLRITHVVYTMNFFWYITGISEPDRYIHGIYMVYTWYVSVI
jgi:hypothetical protein